MAIDLEQFPTSESAREMLSYVTKGWYDNSYVGKWIFQAMGLEMDKAVQYIEELPYQYFVDTATWGLKYHEIKYGLPVRENLSYEERRRIIRERRDTKAPMTPWRMEQIISAATGYNIHVSDVMDGEDYGHPNIFNVDIEGDGGISLSNIIKKINSLKQSHTLFTLGVLLIVILNREEISLKSIIRMPVSWWDRQLDGSFLLDGTFYLDAVYPTQFRPEFRAVFLEAEEWMGAISHRFIYTPVEKTETVLHERIPMYWWEGSRMLNGTYGLGGEIVLSQEYPPTWNALRHRALMDIGESMGFNWYEPAKAISLNGTGMLDGTFGLNSGREEL